LQSAKIGDVDNFYVWLFFAEKRMTKIYKGGKQK